MKRRKKHKRIENRSKGWNEKELNIQYDDVNPQWNYIISPRSNSGKVEGDKK